MLENFKMEITQADFLRIVNHGIKDLTWGHFVDKNTDKVTKVQYSRSTKRYTLCFQSGKKLKVVESKEAKTS